MTYIVTGYYGSGKTEFALNLAIKLAKQNCGYANFAHNKNSHIAQTQNSREITIADLDVVNPFFRSREREKELAPLGIKIAGSVFENHVAQDVPAISFAFLSKIRAGEVVILDLAGGEPGLRLLASCYDAIKTCEFFCVFNLYRSETDSVEKMVSFCQQINAVSRLPVTGLVNNGNLLGLTGVKHVLESQKAVLAACEKLNLPLKYTLVHENIANQISDKIISEKILTFTKPQMRKDWQG